MALTAKETALFKDAFVLFDRDARGAVTAADLEVVWSSMGREFAAGEIEGLVKAVNPAGTLNEAQFLQFMTQMKSKVATQEEIVDALSVFDSSANKDGYVDTSSLKHAMLQMGDERLSERECELFMEIADVNSDGKIQYRELVKYLTQ